MLLPMMTRHCPFVHEVRVLSALPDSLYHVINCRRATAGTSMEKIV